MRFVLGLAACLVLSSTAFARDLSPEQRAAFDEALTKLQEAALADNTDAYIDMMPPAYLEATARLQGRTAEEVATAMKASSREGAESYGIDIVSYSFQFDRIAGGDLVQGNGCYLVIPTMSVARLADGRDLVIAADTIAFLDGGEWYFVRLDSGTEVALVQSAYEELYGTPFKPGTSVLVPPRDNGGSQEPQQ